jgi:dolichol-phosphate mannosyltransferase
MSPSDNVTGSDYHCWCKGRHCDLRDTPPRCDHHRVSMSIVLPTYDEADNIDRLITRLLALVADPNVLITVVDDGSKDGTQEVVRDRIEHTGRVVLLARTNKTGIFSAIQDGVELIDAEFITFMDADFSHPPEMVPPLWQTARECDIASASRYMKGGGIKAPRKRIVASRTLNWVCRRSLQLEATDVLGGFHCMRRTSFRRLEFRYPAIWGEFDLELFFRAKMLGFSLKELPFVYVFRDFGVSKSVDLKYGLCYLRQILRLRLRG